MGTSTLLNSHPDLMIGVATRQNTINTVPAIQFGIPKFQFLETKVAKASNWTKNAALALENKGIEMLNPILIYEEIEPDFLEIEKYLSKIYDPQQPILWNIGGGQKNHVLGLWEAFKKRKNPFDQVCYSNIQARVIEVWCWEDSQIKHHRIPLNYEDDLANYLAVYGFEIKPGEEGELLYENGKVVNQVEYFDYFQFEDFRRFLSKTFNNSEVKSENSFTKTEIIDLLHPDKLNLADEITSDILTKNPHLNRPGGYPINPNFLRFNLVNQILSYLKKKTFIGHRSEPREYQFTNPDLISKLEENGISYRVEMTTNQVVKILSLASGFYFERLLFSRIQKLLAENDHLIKKAYANVKIKSKENETEFDILLLTSLGTLHVLDGKLDAFDKKDENSRKHVLAQAGGAFASFQPVFSFYPEDLDNELVSPALIQKFKDYAIEKSNFMIFNGLDFSQIDIQIHDQKVKIKHFNHLLTHLNLLKS